MKDVVFTTVSPVRYWVHKILPLVYDDSLSYYEVLSKVTKVLNELIENNNNIPDYVAQMIKEYITSGAIGEVVRDVLANFMLNVKNPPQGITPAVGDGSTDDTAAIQGCIDYAAEKGYGCVYIPYGKYLVSSIEAKDNVSIFGYDRYSTGLYLKGGSDKALIYGNAENFGIYNLELNGSAGVQVYDVPVIELSGTNNLFSNLLINECYKGIVYNGTEGHLQIDNIVFGDCAEQGMYIAGDADVQCTNVEFNNLARLSNSPLVEIASANGYYLINSKATCNTCVSVTGNGNMITGFIENSTNPFVDTGSNNYIYASKYYFKLPVNTVELLCNTYNITTTDNYVENVGGNKDSTVNGNLSVRIIKDIKFDAIGESDFTLVGEAIVGESKLSAEEGANVDINIVGEVNATATGAYNVKGKNFNGKFDDYFKVYGKETDLETNEVVIKPADALTYQTPKPFDDNFDYVPFKDYNGTEYKVAVVRRGVSTTIKYAKYFDNTDCVVGTVVRTNGFYEANDGGSAWYYIDNTGNADGITSFKTKNNYIAKLVLESTMDIRKFGGSTSIDDNARILNAAIKYCSGASAIHFTVNETYNFGSLIYIEKDTHLIFDGIINSVANDFYFESYDRNQHPGYTGNGNIVIEGNGLFDLHATDLDYAATLFRFAHGKDITVKDISVREYGCYHCIEIMGCKNVVVDNVKFLGAYSRANLIDSPEAAIQIEPVCNDTGQSGAYPKDNTTCTNITIKNCYFGSSDLDDSLLCDAGVESQTSGITLEHRNIVIENNVFENIRKSCIYAWRWYNAKINGNIARNMGIGFFNVLSRGDNSVVDSIISNNIVETTNSDEPAFYLSKAYFTSIVNNVINDTYGNVFIITGGDSIILNSNVMTDCLRGNVINKNGNFSFLNIVSSTKPNNLIIVNNIFDVLDEDVYTNAIGSGVKVDIFTGNSTNIKNVNTNYFVRYWNGIKQLWTGNISSGSVSEYANGYRDELLLVECQVQNFGRRTFVFDNTDKNNNSHSINFDTVSADSGTVITRSLTFNTSTEGFTIVNNFSSTPTDKISVVAIKTVPMNHYNY